MANDLRIVGPHFVIQVSDVRSTAVLSAPQKDVDIMSQLATCAGMFQADKLVRQQGWLVTQGVVQSGATEGHPSEERSGVALA